MTTYHQNATIEIAAGSYAPDALNIANFDWWIDPADIMANIDFTAGSMGVFVSMQVTGGSVVMVVPFSIGIPATFNEANIITALLALAQFTNSTEN